MLLSKCWSFTALSDFWKSHKSNLSVFEFHPNNKDVFTSIDSCLFEDIVYSKEDNKSSDPGAFECEIYEYTLDKQFLDNFYQNISYSDLIDQNEYKEFIERFHGIKCIFISFKL